MCESYGGVARTDKNGKRKCWTECLNVYGIVAGINNTSKNFYMMSRMKKKIDMYSFFIIRKQKI